MTDDLRNVVASIKAVTPQLNKAVDDAAAMVADAERFLTDECGFGIPCQVEICSHEVNLRSVETTYLVYDRFGGKFRIGVRVLNVRVLEQYPAPATEQPWTNCDRAMKLQSFAKLPDLLKVAAEKAQKMIETSQSTNATVAAMLAGLRADETPAPPTPLTRVRPRVRLSPQD